jgi:hypothetical protein
MLTIDNLAHRYGMLPSEVLCRATTFDLSILDASAKWERYQYDKANGVTPKNALPNQEEMLAMIKRVREKSDD